MSVYMCLRVCALCMQVCVFAHVATNPRNTVRQSVLPTATRHLTPCVVDPDCVAPAKLGLVEGGGDGGRIGSWHRVSHCLTWCPIKGPAGHSSLIGAGDASHDVAVSLEDFPSTLLKPPFVPPASMSLLPPFLPLSSSLSLFHF